MSSFVVSGRFQREPDGGRRPSRRRGAAVVAAATLLGAGWATPPVHAARTAGGCTVRALPSPAGTTSGVSGADPNGRYMVGAWVRPGEGTQHPVLWDTGRETDLDVPLAAPGLADVNGQGTVVGDGAGPDGRRFVFSYRNGVYTILPNPNPTDSAIAIGVNEHGDVLGNVYNRTDKNAPHRAVVWPGAKPGAYRQLPAPGSATPRGIAEDGSVVGVVGEQGYRWAPDGTGHALPAGPDGPSVYASAARGRWVVGLEQGHDGRLPVRWNVTAGTAARLPALTQGPSDVNADGTVAAATAEGGVLIRDGRLIALPNLPGSWNGQARTVADRSDTAAGEVTDNAGTHAVSWQRC